MNGMVIRRLVSAILFLSLTAAAAGTTAGCQRQSLNSDGRPSFEGTGIGPGDPRYVASASATIRLSDAQANYINANAEAVRSGRYPTGYGGHAGMYAPGFVPPGTFGMPGSRSLCIGNESAWDVRIEIASQSPGVDYFDQFNLATGSFWVVYVQSGDYRLDATAISTGRGVRVGSIITVPDRSNEMYRGTTFNKVWEVR